MVRKFRTSEDEKFIFDTLQQAHDEAEVGMLKDKLMRAWLLMMKPAAIGFIDGAPTDADLATIAAFRKSL